MPPNPSTPSLELGSTLAHFELVEVLGEGGMGIVFRAQDTIVRRQVALKVMQPHLAKQTKSRERFLREARIAASVEHDRIVRIYEVNEDRGTPYIAMELLKGESLDKKMIHDHRLPLSFTFRIIRQIAEGLAVAHEKGLIHRDIKPSNIWLEPYEGSFRCKILDFGLARAVEGDSISTHSGQMTGTPSYMSPEQWKGKEVDSRTDLYSLGIMLYQMTTGKTPFQGESHASLMYQVLTEEPKSPMEWNPRLPPMVSDLIHQLIAKEKEKRPARAQEVIRSLDQISKQATDLARELSGLSHESIVIPDTLSARETERDRPSKRNRDDSPTPPITISPKSHLLPWIVMFVGLLVGISGIVIATQKQTTDRSVEFTQLLTEKSQIEERFKQLETELANKGKKSWEELEAEKKRLADYASLRKEKSQLETEFTRLEKKFLKEQQSNSEENSSLEKIVKTQREDLLKLQVEKQNIETKLKLVDGKVQDHLSRLAEMEVESKSSERKISNLVQEKQLLQLTLESLKTKVANLEKNQPLLGKQSKPALLDCTGINGASENTVKSAQKAWANYLGVSVEESIDLGNGVKMELVLIPPGKYRMGATKEEHEVYTKTTLKEGDIAPAWFSWELPQHEVTITKPFYMSKYEVTQEEYTTLTQLPNPSHFHSDNEKVAKKDTKRFPVEKVSWDEAKKFLELLEKKQQLKKVKSATFPTEAQWEYACRAGTRTPFHFGDVLNGEQANSDGDTPYGTTTKGTRLQRTVEVDSKEFKPNAFGLHQMHGNVFEWCLDGFDAKAYGNHAKSDPVTLEPNLQRVVRGGSWLFDSGACRSAVRSWYGPGDHENNVGIRVLLELED